MSSSTTSLSIRSKDGSAKVDVADWGYPGFLTDDQHDAYESFRAVVRSRGDEFRAAVYAFGEEYEEEPYALCRWLRARRFSSEDAVRAVEEAVERRRPHAVADFYPDPRSALGGAEASTFVSQYPQTYAGVSKSGSPIFLSKPGLISTGGLECLTTLEGIVRYHWHDMVHSCGSRMRECAVTNPDFKRFECFCVLDLTNLSASTVTKRALKIVNLQTEIDASCFPDTLEKYIIINAPSFFSFTWKIIKKWVDPRTAAKVEIYSVRAKAEKRLLELVDADQLPADYGGAAPDTSTSLEADALRREDARATRQIVELLAVRSSASTTVDLRRDETLRVGVFTRCATGANVFASTDEENDERPRQETAASVRHEGRGTETEDPTRVDLERDFVGPATVRIRVESRGKTTLLTRNFLLVGKVYSTEALAATASNDVVARDSAPSTDVDESSTPANNDRGGGALTDLAPSTRRTRDDDSIVHDRPKNDGRRPNHLREPTSAVTPRGAISVRALSARVNSRDEVDIRFFPTDAPRPKQGSSGSAGNRTTMMRVAKSKARSIPVIVEEPEYLRHDPPHQHQLSRFMCGFDSCW